MCLIKTNSVGDTLWAKLYGGLMIDECYEVVQTTDGGYIMCGKSFSFSASGDYDVYVVKVNGQGVVQWSKTFGNSSSSSSNDIGNAIQQTYDGGYIIAGESLFGFGVGLKNMYLIKTDSLGNSGCNQGTPATITSNLLPQVIVPPTITSSGGIVSYPATLVNSGSIQTNLCLSTGIAENTSVQHLVIYPNPFSNTACLEFTLPAIKSVSISIIDIVGRELKSIPTENLQEGKNKITIDLSELNSGIYLLKVKSSGNLQTVKLIKN